MAPTAKAKTSVSVVIVTETPRIKICFSMLFYDFSLKLKVDTTWSQTFES